MADTQTLFLSGEQVPEYLKGVELLTAGMSWPSMTGPVTITMEHLADAVRAASDPHIQSPRIKLGHTSSLNGDHPDYDPFAAIGDAEPAFGQFVNLRLENDGAVLVGDATNVPAWLAAMAPSAYPSRSAEATWQVQSADFDVQTAGGKRYQMVATAISLLGVYIPAISDLEDLSTLIMAGPSALPATPPPVAAAASPDAALSVSTDVIRQRFNFDWAMEGDGRDPAFEGDTYWWWARDIRVDANEVIADDDEGNLWSVPYSTDGADAVTFGLPVAVRQTFVPVAASTVASFARPDKPTKPSRPPAAAASTTAATVRPNTEEGATMDDDVRDILVGQGLDPTAATEDQINAANIFAAAAKLNPPTSIAAGDSVVANDETGQAPAVVETAGNDATPVDTERVPVAASRQLPDGAVIIDADELARLRAGAETATRLAAEQTTRERDTILSAARDEGRFPPARLAHYTKLYEADPEGTRTLLTAAEDQGGLAKGTVPLAAKSTAPDPEGLGDDGLSGADRALLAASRARAGFKQEVQS